MRFGIISVTKVEKILKKSRKNLEVKKKSVSLQPI